MSPVIITIICNQSLCRTSIIVESISTISLSFNLRGHGIHKCTGLLVFTKLATFTPFATYSIVGKVNKNALLVQTVLY